MCSSSRKVSSNSQSVQYLFASEKRKKTKTSNMFSIDSIEFESIMNRHIFDYQTSASTASSLSSTDLFMCNDDSSDSDLYSYSSDQENNIDKM